MERDIVEVLDCIATNRDAGEWMQKEAARAAAEIRRLRAIVDRLPKTADGVVVAPGDAVWRLIVGPRGGVTYELLTVGSDGFAGRWWADDDPNSIGDEWDPSCFVDDCYSTREAAEAARAAVEDRK